MFGTVGTQSRHRQSASYSKTQHRICERKRRKRFSDPEALQPSLTSVAIRSRRVDFSASVESAASPSDGDDVLWTSEGNPGRRDAVKNASVVASAVMSRLMYTGRRGGMPFELRTMVWPSSNVMYYDTVIDQYDTVTLVLERYLANSSLDHLPVIHWNQYEYCRYRIVAAKRKRGQCRRS